MGNRTVNSMIMNWKIKAFTILELVLAMLLAAIVIAMAYSAYSIFTKVYKNYSLNVDRNTELLLLRKVLNTDFDTSGSITVKGNRIVFGRKDEADTIAYEIYPQFMVRVSVVPDTFYLKDLIVVGSFENQQRVNGRLDQLTFHFQQADVPFVWSVNKLYTSAELFRLYQN